MFEGFVWLKDDVASRDEEEPPTAAAFGDKKATCTLSPGYEPTSCRDGETERGSGRVVNVYGWVRGEGGHEELGTFQEGH